MLATSDSRTLRHPDALCFLGETSRGWMTRAGALHASCLRLVFDSRLTLPQDEMQRCVDS